MRTGCSGAPILDFRHNVLDLLDNREDVLGANRILAFGGHGNKRILDK
jgi:hypothetical protein